MQKFLFCLWPPYVIGQAIYFHPVVSFFFFPFPNLSGRRLNVYHTSHTWRGLSVHLECRSETCCLRLAENTARKKSPKSRHLGTIPQFCRSISSQLRHVSTIGKKNLLSSNMSSTCHHNMVNFGLLAAEICWRVWGTPANFKGFRVLVALLHATLVVGVSQTLRRWTEVATYIRQGGHHVGHWLTFLVLAFCCLSWMFSALALPTVRNSLYDDCKRAELLSTFYQW